MIRAHLVQAHWRNLVYIVRHKWYVIQECRKLGPPVWVGLLHDWQKFTRAEWSAYAERFYQYGHIEADHDLPHDVWVRYKRAWLHHQHFGPHHWQYWVLKEDNGSTRVLPMPDRYRREMLADWRAAGRAQGRGDNTREWYMQRRHTMLLHRETRAWIEWQLGIIAAPERIYSNGHGKHA